MGEVVASCCEEAMDDAVVMMEEGRENEENRGNNEGSNSVVRWESLLPRTVIRVLLVEADDSTRQIIAALLRKCNYKVASVADGLKAWEVLKARHHNIDLILTEAELPLISGYALLTLISEHHLCKNIPVIMMSAHDSVSMVYKCMLRGAADFLVKPIRINELKNLWQHVWRRQSVNREAPGPQHESFTQQKLEATAENTGASDHSSSSKSCAPPRQEECINKRSDELSSCWKPDLEAESPYKAGPVNQILPQQAKSPTSALNLLEQSNFGNSIQNLCTPESAVAGSVTAACNDNDAFEQNGGENKNLYPEATDISDNLHNPSREVIDLIGAFDNHSRHHHSCSNDRTNRPSFLPQLDLSLRRYHPGVNPENKSIHEKQMLNHSNGSAFTRYINNMPPNSNAKVISGSASKEDKVNCADQISGIVHGSNSNNKEIPHPNDRKALSLPINLSKEAENHASMRLFPIPFPGYGPTASPIVCSPSSSHSPCLGNQKVNYFHQFSTDVLNGTPQYQLLDQSPRISCSQPISKQDQQMDSSADQSASSTYCNGTTHVSSYGCGPVGGGEVKVNQDAVVPGGSDSGHEQLTRQQSIQREAALTKFRLKRKERCFEKKIRYESRKKLAEQRPRVKGQFVRQVPPDPPPPKSDNSGGISVSNHL